MTFRWQLLLCVRKVKWSEKGSVVSMGFKQTTSLHSMTVSTFMLCTIIHSLILPLHLLKGWVVSKPSASQLINLPSFLSPCFPTIYHSNNLSLGLPGFLPVSVTAHLFFIQVYAPAGPKCLQRSKSHSQKDFTVTVTYDWACKFKLLCTGWKWFKFLGPSYDAKMVVTILVSKSWKSSSLLYSNICDCFFIYQCHVDLAHLTTPALLSVTTALLVSTRMGMVSLHARLVLLDWPQME